MDHAVDSWTMNWRWLLTEDWGCLLQTKPRIFLTQSPMWMMKSTYFSGIPGALRFARKTLASACASDWDCSLNGVCDLSKTAEETAATCICDAPWSGPQCGRLAFAPGTETFCGVECAYHGADYPNSTSWGGSVLRAEEDGRYVAPRRADPSRAMAGRAMTGDARISRNQAEGARDDRAI